MIDHYNGLIDRLVISGMMGDVGSPATRRGQSHKKTICSIQVVLKFRIDKVKSCMEGNLIYNFMHFFYFVLFNFKVAAELYANICLYTHTQS